MRKQHRSGGGGYEKREATLVILCLAEHQSGRK